MNLVVEQFAADRGHHRLPESQRGEFYEQGLIDSFFVSTRSYLWLETGP